MDRKIILWSVALFFGSAILFRAIDAATAHSGKGVSLGAQLGALVLIVAAIAVIARKRS